VTCSEAVAIRDAFFKDLGGVTGRSKLEDDLRYLGSHLGTAFGLALGWIEGFLARDALDEASTARRQVLIAEVAALLLTGSALPRLTSSALTRFQVTGVVGQHPRVVNQALDIYLDEFLVRLRHFAEVQVPAFARYREMGREYLERAKRALRIDAMRPEVLTTFVRNRLIDEVYLPLIGDNLAKQMGSLGADARSDRSGLLLLISPPGYGKTTLMEYIASRLGLVFMKINGPAVGHAVTSIDPGEAPNATARQEVERLNLALEMGNNVMLYLDDIQHTNPELLQKFISLCDAQRKIEGVWKGETKTHDLRGKRFAVVMAGNP
jgi:hypothetical protein